MPVRSPYPDVDIPAVSLPELLFGDDLGGYATLPAFVEGWSVAPAELEAVLLTHDRIADAAVIGVRDADGNEVPKGCVVPRPGVDLTAAEVLSFVAERVAPYKKVRMVEFVAAIPKSASGKILRKDLRAREALSTPAAPAAETGL